MLDAYLLVEGRGAERFREAFFFLVQIMLNGRMRWWTEHGYPAYVAATDNPGTFGIRETAVLTITSCSPGGIVKATVSAPSEQPVDFDESRRYSNILVVK